MPRPGEKMRGHGKPSLLIFPLRSGKVEVSRRLTRLPNTMMRYRTLLAAAVTALLIGTASAQEPIRFARTPDLSPDGKTVAFSYLGDIWTVEAIGGVARPVSMHEAHDVNPVFSPDGKQIAFSSNRHGSYDVFVVPPKASD